MVFCYNARLDWINVAVRVPLGFLFRQLDRRSEEWVPVPSSCRFISESGYPVGGGCGGPSIH
jgi:hypothetical protein